MFPRALPVLALLLLADAAPAAPVTVGGQPYGTELLPDGATVTPLAAPGSVFQALPTGLRPDYTANVNSAVTAVLSPDGTALAIITSGYNTYFYTTNRQPITHVVLDPQTGLPSPVTTINAESIFIVHVRGAVPVIKQRLEMPDTYHGLVWDPAGGRFYVSAGNDDRIYAFKATSSGAAADATYVADAPFILLGHNSSQTAPLPGYDGGIFSESKIRPEVLKKTGIGPTSALAAGLSISGDGTLMAVANLQNDSVSLIDPATRRVTREVRFLSPGGARAVGEMPYWTAIACTDTGAPRRVFVTSQRDGQVMAVDPATGDFNIIRLGGEPGRMRLSRDQSTLFVANPDLDEIELIDTHKDAVLARISVARPGDTLRGSMPNDLILSADESTLFATLGGENAVAVIDLRTGTVLGRIPTGWYPSALALTANNTLLVTNLKNDSGPTNYRISLKNDGEILPHNGVDGYVLGLEKAGILSLPLPDTATLQALSVQVDRNNLFQNRAITDPMMSFLHQHIKHVIFVLKENRTYDQILGDDPRGDGDPKYVEFPNAISPNHHALTTRFALLDNFYTAGDVSGDGWNWTFQGHANDYTNKTVPVGYGNASVYGSTGLSGSTIPFDWNGNPRNISVALPETTKKTPGFTTVRMTTLLDPSLQSGIEPGIKDITADAGADDETAAATGGYIWDTAIRAGKSLRHYGVYVDEDYYFPGSPLHVPIVRNAWFQKTPQAVAVRPSLLKLTDPYYRGWDLSTPDQYRIEEWQREFTQYEATGTLPDMELLVLMMDHFGNFKTNVAGLDTPPLQLASNDYAIGQLAETVSNAPNWASTAIFILEDDSQDGPDHVESHRSIVQVISPYTRAGAVIHTNYNTVNVLRTIEDILGVPDLGMNDANALPMSDVFTTTPDLTPYSAIIPGVLCQPPVDPTLVPQCGNRVARRTQAVRFTHDGAWWDAHTQGMDFSGPDRTNAARFNRLLWQGLKGDTAYPAP